MFLEQGNEDKRKHYLKTVEREEEMNKALIDRSAELELEDDDQETYLLKPEEIFINPGSGARLTIFNSTILLRRYCAMMPKDEFTVTEPVYLLHDDVDGQWAVVHLPLSVPPDCRVFTGGKTQGRNRAKQYAAFKAIKMLNEAGELDDRFRPIHLDIDEGGLIKPTIQSIGACKVREFHAGLIASNF